MTTNMSGSKNVTVALLSKRDFRNVQELGTCLPDGANEARCSTHSEQQAYAPNSKVCIVAAWEKVLAENIKVKAKTLLMHSKCRLPQEDQDLVDALKVQMLPFAGRSGRTYTCNAVLKARLSAYCTRVLYVGGHCKKQHEPDGTMRLFDADKKDYTKLKVSAASIVAGKFQRYGLLCWCW